MNKQELESELAELREAILSEIRPEFLDRRRAKGMTDEYFWQWAGSVLELGFDDPNIDEFIELLGQRDEAGEAGDTDE